LKFFESRPRKKTQTGIRVRVHRAFLIGRIGEENNCANAQRSQVRDQAAKAVSVILSIKQEVE